MKDRGNRRGSDSTRAFGLGAVMTLVACGETGAPDGAAGAAAGAGGEASPAAASEARWASVRRAVLDAADAADADLALSVWDANDLERFEVSRGAFTADTRVAVASASKFASGLVLFELIARGQLSLSSTTGEVLGWAGAHAAISLEQLLSFTSGLPRDTPCTATLITTLAACVDSIAELEPESPPGSVFDYGSTHLAVAARMAEVASGSSWAELFDEILRVPLGLPADVAYFTFPRRALGRTNPLAAGGLRASMNEYAPLLQLALHRGTRGALSVGTPEL
ncbi:MAG TPA: serine hydrolase domain-containing protein, partial [Polyangiaceae bacterium]|nr:serine hydrolase domain-containing protein [Polyangiaceae bacterium]